MHFERITGPAEEPVTLTEAKAHLRVVDDSEDTLIAMLITAAREHCEDVARRTFVTQTYALTLDNWPDKPLALPLPPVAGITSIVYTDDNGNVATLATSVYVLDGGKLFVAPNQSWPSTSLRQYAGVKVTYTAGYGDAADVPSKYKQAVLLTLGHWFQNREAVVVGTSAKELPLAAKALLMTDRGY